MKLKLITMHTIVSAKVFLPLEWI